MNLFKRFQKLIPTHPLRVGTVESVTGTQVTVVEVSGNPVVIRGEAQVGQLVYFRDSVLEGVAPQLPYVEVEE